MSKIRNVKTFKNVDVFETLRNNVTFYVVYRLVNARQIFVISQYIEIWSLLSFFSSILILCHLCTEHSMSVKNKSNVCNKKDTKKVSETDWQIGEIEVIQVRARHLSIVLIVYFWFCHWCSDLELITLDLPSPFAGAGLNRDSLLAAYERVLTDHPNICFVVLGELAPAKLIDFRWIATQKDNDHTKKWQKMFTLFFTVTALRSLYNSFRWRSSSHFSQLLRKWIFRIFVHYELCVCVAR